MPLYNQARMPQYREAQTLREKHIASEIQTLAQRKREWCFEFVEQLGLDKIVLEFDLRTLF